MNDLPGEENEIVFLTVEQVIALHAEAIQRYAPQESRHILDRGLLESSVMAPRQTWDGDYIYPTVTAMAAQYLFGINQNHAFENGNKRVAFAACSTFLQMNGYQLTLTEQEAANLTLDVAAHRIEKEDVIAALENAIKGAV